MKEANQPPHLQDRRPNDQTVAAISELEAGGGRRFGTIAELMADLHADDDQELPDEPVA